MVTFIIMNFDNSVVDIVALSWTSLDWCGLQPWLQSIRQISCKLHNSKWKKSVKQKVA
jgi:hypothetical protein